MFLLSLKSFLIGIWNVSMLRIYEIKLILWHKQLFLMFDCIFNCKLYTCPLLPEHILCLSRLIYWSFWPGLSPSTKNQGQPLDNCVSVNGRSAQALLRPAYYENRGTSRCFGRLQVCTRPTYNQPPRSKPNNEITRSCRYCGEHLKHPG